MREFLKDIKIVGATLASREGQLIRYCLDNLIEYCKSIENRQNMQMNLKKGH